MGLSIYPPPTSTAVAQSANRVLSEVLSNPPYVLSAMPTCCQLCSVASLGRLLIKIRRRLREFDGEEGLYTGMRVELMFTLANQDPSVILPMASCHVIAVNW